MTMQEMRSKLQAERPEVSSRVAQCREKYAALEKLQVREGLQRLKSGIVVHVHSAQPGFTLLP